MQVQSMTSDALSCCRLSSRTCKCPDSEVRKSSRHLRCQLRNQSDSSKYEFLVWFLDLKFQRVIRPSGPRLAAPKSAVADLGNLGVPISGKPEIGYHAPIIEWERGPQISLRNLRKRFIALRKTGYHFC